MRYPLRTFIPFLLLLSTALLAFYLHSLENHRRVTEIENNASEEIKRIAATTIRSFKLLYSIHPELIQELFPTFGSDAQISEFMLFNEDNIIMASLYDEDVNQTVQSIINNENTAEWAELARFSEELKKNRHSQWYYSYDRNFVYALYPVFLPILSGNTAAPLKNDVPPAILYIKKDLRQLKAQGHTDVDRQVMESTLYFIAVALLLWIFSHYFVSNRVSKLLAATKQFSLGNLAARSELSGGDELATISKAFDRMAAMLGNTMTNLKDSEQTTRLLMESTAEGIIAIDLKGDCIMANPSSLVLLGYEHPGDLIGKNMHNMLHHTHPDGTPYPASSCPITDTLRNGRVIHNDEEYFWRRDGSWMHTEYWSYPVRKKGHIIGAVVTFLDITKRKKAQIALQVYQAHLEDIIKERTNELTVVNDELRAFSYSVSHDLRAPLRSIRGFSEALLEEHADKLGNQGRDYLKRIHTAAGRMNDLIRDILALSQVTRTIMCFTTVDLSRLAREIMQGLEQLYPERRITYDISDGLFVEGDEGLLRIALENLLNNAWKFTERKEQARIIFGKRSMDDHDVFYIQDNGSGFDMNYVDKLFIPFQRLHTLDEFEGTGIGLATVQNIIHRHGGEVWAEGRPGHGATLYFTLKPVQQIETPPRQQALSG